jgi:hypothetical protein
MSLIWGGFEPPKRETICADDPNLLWEWAKRTARWFKAYYDERGNLVILPDEPREPQ